MRPSLIRRKHYAAVMLALCSSGAGHFERMHCGRQDASPQRRVLALLAKRFVREYNAGQAEFLLNGYLILGSKPLSLYKI
jgi:hypothetical protein